MYREPEQKEKDNQDERNEKFKKIKVDGTWRNLDDRIPNLHRASDSAPAYEGGGFSEILDIIFRTHTEFMGSAWLAYDESVRMRAAVDVSLKWNWKDHELWLQNLCRAVVRTAGICWDTGIRDTEIKNQSVTMEFTLVGLTTSTELQTLLFGVFAFIYATALASNLLLIFIICTCRKLHTPMYFLLINLSLVNVFSISVTTPKLLQTLWTHRNTISFYGCFAQLFLFVWCLSTELFLLSFMGFDRYAAICHPLQYTVIMKKEVCVGIASGVWLAGMVNSAVNVGLMLKLSFCNSNVVNHFFCDLPPLLKLSCSDTSLNEMMAFVADVIIGVSSCGLTLTSYCFILRAIFRIRSTEGKKKAFSTCSSHFIVVSFYFSTVIYTYTGIRPSSDYSLDKDKFLSLLYTVVPPVVNPLIYSLRNKEVKEALKAITRRGRLLQRPQA
ncbi:olfactory receptor 13G1-like [Rhineura floridana]|uniref:olfactory receptor 13G1-like n=1 Tax=Rhineura floridana TaxID=261503 RepID=UPI002AC80200|nr:olfactory receptor 13G1-like [Rhineura floridana]